MSLIGKLVPCVRQGTVPEPDRGIDDVYRSAYETRWSGRVPARGTDLWAVETARIAAVEKAAGSRTSRGRGTGLPQATLSHPPGFRCL
ncbi:hypothetical protein C3Y87_01475 [Carbonactinospora thermoautotrophica]|nr:hypothetical protein [Carbonactinospora thermoautotrophica]